MKYFIDIANFKTQVSSFKFQISKPKFQVSSFLLFLCIFFSACGYKFEGGGNFPGGIKSVYITVFENRTAETGLETIFANDFIDEFTRRGKLVLAGRDSAEAILAGEIKSVNLETVSRRESHTALERQIKVVVALKLTSSDGKVIWSAKQISAHEAYIVMPDKMTTEYNRQQAISVISEKIAETAYDHLTSDF
ncbi:LptE family protein [Desulfonema magnum]|nr:LptE family protein [Desulfonema magnum]